MEGSREEGEQEDSTITAIQGRDSDRIGRSEAQGGCGGIKERTESRAEPHQTQKQAKNRAGRVWGQSRGEDTVNSAQILSSDNKDLFRVLCTNARSIIGKIDLLKSYVFDLKPAVVCVCEASTNNTISNTFLHLDGYSLLVRTDGSDTKNGWCRGLLIYVRVDITATRLELSIVDSMVECDGVTIPWGNKGEFLSIILAYRPPRPPGSEADNGYCDKFCDLVTNLKSPAVIVGDLNWPGIDWTHLHASSSAEKNVLETLQNCFWTQHVDFPTRRDPGTGEESLLDLCLSSTPDLILSVESQGLFSDHIMYSPDLIRPSAVKSSKELVPDWAKADLDKLVSNLAQLDWESVMQSMSGVDRWEFVKKTIADETEACVPKKVRRVSSRPLWMTKNVMRLIRKKKRLWKWYSKSHDFHEFMAYKTVQDKVRKAVKNAKRNFERKLARDANRNNTKPNHSSVT